MDWPIGNPVGISLVLVWEGEGPSLVVGAIPELVVLGSTRKQAEQGMGSRAVGGIPPWPL